MGKALVAGTVVSMLAAALVTATPAAAEFDYQPLWPFTSQDDADHWARDGGEPWHADAEATALRFTREYLRFGEIDRVTAVETEDGEAWIGVGYSLGEGETSTVATIHLARYGDDPGAPWEVVGTRDEILTLQVPSYGAAVGPVFEAGGTISGVDESLRLQVHQTSEIGGYCCLPAGGQDTPWSAEVSTDGAEPGVAILVVSTGGHVAEVERFAVTGLRFGG